MTPQFKYSVIYSFTGGSDGANPTGKLIQNASSVMFGTAINGGQPSQSGQCVSSGCGTIFQITSSGVFTLLYTFTNGSDGYNPWGALTLDSAGNLYGVTDDTSTEQDSSPRRFNSALNVC